MRLKRFDEYDHREAPLRARAWRKLQQEGGFFQYSFEDMTAGEVSQTVYVAFKVGVKSELFWQRAASATADLATAMNAKQLATACYAFGVTQWMQDDALQKAFTPAVVKSAPEMKPGDLAAVATAFARAKVKQVPMLRAVSEAAASNPRFGGKGFVIVADCFASLGFEGEAFHQRLASWAREGGLNACSGEQAVTIAQAAAFSSGLASAEGFLPALFHRLAKFLETDALVPQVLLATVGALSRLPLHEEDHAIVALLEKAVGHDLYHINVQALPPLLDAFARIYEKVGGGGGGGVARERLRVVSLLTGTVTRELRQLRPQEACRSLQALERLGLVDPYLCAGVAEAVPERLLPSPPSTVLELLEAYAEAGNRDGFMIACLRRVLLPAVTTTRTIEDEEPLSVGRIDSAPLAQLDDFGVVRTAEAFARLGHSAGILAVLAALQHADARPSRRLAHCCAFALASTVEVHVPSSESWNEAAQLLTKAEPAAASGIMRSLGPEVEASWRSMGNMEAIPADALLLASSAFPRHARQAQWQEALARRVQECSPGLLPGLIAASSGSLRGAAENALVVSLLRGAAAGFTYAVTVAAIRALTRCASSRPPGHHRRLRDAVHPLVRRLIDLADAGTQVSPKGLIRALQALQVLQVEPPNALVRAFSEVGGLLLPHELIFALRLLTPGSVQTSGHGPALAGLATRAMAQLRSSRQAWELEALCKGLSLDLGEVEALEEEGEADAEAGPAPASAAGAAAAAAAKTPPFRRAAQQRQAA